MFAHVCHREHQCQDSGSATVLPRKLAHAETHTFDLHISRQRAMAQP